MKNLIFSALASVLMALGLINFAGASSTDACRYVTGAARSSAVCQGGSDAKNNIAPKVVGTLAWIVGALAVIMIIWAGIQYTISAGDSGKINKAKTTLIYSVVGLVIAVMAGVIVNFILSKV